MALAVGLGTPAEMAAQLTLPLQAAILRSLGGIVPFAPDRDGLWTHGSHPFVAHAHAKGSPRPLSTLVAALARRNGILVRLAVTKALLDDLDQRIASMRMVRAPASAGVRLPRG